MHWTGSQDHREATRLLEERGRKGLSLVDCTSFLVMQHYGVSEALAFDPDFEQERFLLV